MTLHWQDWPQEALTTLRRGSVIPAHPLALTEQRTLDKRRQRALSRYYLDAGAGGLAVGVHTTQFAIRDAGLYAPVLELAAATLSGWRQESESRLLIAGLCGSTQQACAEAEIARSLGYHAGLLSLAAHPNASEDELIAHCQQVASIMPVMGFYLQTAVGGIPLSAAFWQRFAAIDNVVAIKVAPFDRYRTLDVVRGVVAAGAEERVMLYTGNDDHIVLDLITPFVVARGEQMIRLNMRGGLLGHWCVWTRSAVQLLERIQHVQVLGQVDNELLALDSQVTDCNSAFFDVANDFRGCIAGCHEVLRRQGLLLGTWCLDPKECLSPGQSEQIDRVYADYPHLNDDYFVATNLERWLSD